MAESFIQVPPDSSGKQVDTWTLAVTGYHRQGIVIGDSSTDGNVVAIPSTGKLPVQTEQQLDYDTGGGTASLSLIGLGLPASGGPVAGGTTTAPVYIATTTTLNINATTTALPSGASTVAAQTTGNNSLASIDAKLSAGINTTVSGTVTVSNTTVNAIVTSSALPSGAATSANQTSVIGSKAPGTAAASALLTGAIYSTTAPTLTDTQQVALQVSSTGNLKVSIAEGGGSGGTASSFGAAFPATGTAIGFEDSTGDMAPVVLEADGSIPVTIVAGAGSGGTAQDDRANFTAGVTPGTPAMGVYEDTPTTVANNKVGLVRISTNRELHSLVVNTTRSVTGTVTVANTTVNAIVTGTVAFSNTNINATISNTVVATVTNAVLSSWDESSRAKVNPIVGQAGVAGNTGGVTASTQRVVLATDEELPEGSNFIGFVGVQATVASGCSLYRSLDVNATTAAVTANPGTFYFIHYVNRTTSPLYIKLFNNTTGAVTLGTTAPQMTIEIPANATDHIAGQVGFAPGIRFSTAISIACVTGLLDSSTTAPAANGCVVNLGYE